MQYHETCEGQIRADLARRIGLIMANEYKGNYDVTLCLSLFQTLLTQCQELIKSIDIGDLPHKMLFDPLTKYPVYGVSTDFIVLDNFSPDSKPKNTWSKRDNLFKVQESIRNSLCHPIPKAVDLITDKYLTTGYTAAYKNSKIDKVIFIHSPNINSQGKLKKDKNGQDVPYKVFRIDMPVDHLKTLLFNLSQLLAQPLDKGWNGKYITPLNELPQVSGF